MRSNEHRPERFVGIGLGIPEPSEVRGISGTSNPLRSPQLCRSDSPVEAQICFQESLRELSQYLITLSPAEMLAIQAQVVYPDGDLIKRMKQRLGVADERLMEIKEEMKSIIFG